MFCLFRHVCQIFDGVIVSSLEVREGFGLGNELFTHDGSASLLRRKVIIHRRFCLPKLFEFGGEVADLGAQIGDSFVRCRCCSRMFGLQLPMLILQRDVLRPQVFTVVVELCVGLCKLAMQIAEDAGLLLDIVLLGGQQVVLVGNVVVAGLEKIVRPGEQDMLCCEFGMRCGERLVLLLEPFVLCRERSVSAVKRVVLGNKIGVRARHRL